ncbi:TraV family lipoprotein [Desulfogranum marinum]|uniref:TraV family lipoprotein n=1 Tax=Desulfogranum marinum TaxID=453220 RepID=UPI0029C7E294|nr:TraV family lipoprotein [Desulfogranum marinum]
MNPFNRIIRYSSPLILLLLAGCGPVLNPYNEDFKCQARNDMGECIDTPTAYKKARYPETQGKEGSSPLDSTQQETLNNRYSILAELLQEEKKPLLQPPKILRVLLLPYKGEGEELFMSRYVYLKIEDSKWILTDLTEEQ